MACIHGNDPSTCLVCKTLAEIDRPSSPTAGGRHGRGATPVDLVTRTDRAPRARDGRSFGTHVAVFAAVLIAAAVSVWFVAGIIFAIVRLLEIVAVAAVAGTLGYRLGHARGRREHH